MKNTKTHVAKLVKKLEQASAAYYNGTPTISDAEFDKSKIELTRMDPDNAFLALIGAPVPGTKKVKHSMPMGSQSNALNKEEFLKWVKRIKAEGQDINLTHKMDGSSLELVYRNGEFVQAITRGDGIEGQDVTRNVLRSKHFPRKVHPYITSVRCEAILHLADFDKHFVDKSNARNTAAGLLTRHDGKGSEYLRFYAFDVISEETIQSETAISALLHNNGFSVPEHKTSNNVEKLWDWHKKQESYRDDLPYEIDGVVAKLDDRFISQNLGVSSGCPKGQIAMKFKSRGSDTALINVVWQVGQTGRINPVAEVAPVGVGGTVIQRATLNNPDEINRLGIAIGDTIEVVRAADVIPKITKIVRKGKSRKNITIPKKCPVCGGIAIKQGAYLFCQNDECSGRAAGRIKTWINKRNILNIGVGILKVLEGRVTQIHELYKLKVNDWAELPVGNGNLGMPRAKKIMESLELSRSVDIPTFLGSMGISLVGRSLARDMCKSLNIKKLDEVFDIKVAQIEAINGFGPERAEAFCKWIKDNKKEINILAKKMKFKVDAPKTGTLSGKRICFTGKCELPRKELQGFATDAGAIIASSVNKDTDILVIADPNSTSVKAQKARKCGVELVSEEYFLIMVGQ